MAIDPTLFPPLPKAAYGPEQLHQYLAGLVSRGYTVYRDPQQQNVFYIPLTDAHRIRISVSEGRSQVQLHYLSNMQNYLDASSLPELEKAIVALAVQAGVRWPSKPTSGRLGSETQTKCYKAFTKCVAKVKDCGQNVLQPFHFYTSLLIGYRN